METSGVLQTSAIVGYFDLIGSNPRIPIQVYANRKCLIWEKWKRIILLGTFFVLAIGIPWEIHAENATVTFGSNYYTATDNETFPIGVYLNGDSRIGTYEVKISTIADVWSYTGVVISEENGVITLSGTGVNAQVKYDSKTVMR